MLLRKITIDNSVRYIPKTAKLQEKEIRPKTIKAGSLPRKQKKTFHKIVKNSLKMWQGVDLQYLNE